jgi:hypothetical protein
VVARSQSEASLGKIERPYLKNKPKQKGLEVCGSSGRVIGSTEFKPQYCSSPWKKGLEKGIDRTQDRLRHELLCRWLKALK